MRSTDTICKHCIFAEWREAEQIGCVAGRLDKFHSVGVNLSPETDGVQTYCKIENRICLMLRTEKWKDKQGGSPPANLISIARKEISLPYEAFIFANKQSFSAIQDSFHSLINQILPPKKITVILNYQGAFAVQILRWLQHAHSTDIVWQVCNIHEEHTRGWCLNHAIQKVEQPWHLIIDAGFVLQNDIASSIDENLNDNLERFSLFILSYNQKNYFIQTVLHNYVEGYEDDDLIHRLEKTEALGLIKYGYPNQCYYSES